MFKTEIQENSITPKFASSDNEGHSDSDTEISIDSDEQLLSDSLIKNISNILEGIIEQNGSAAYSENDKPFSKKSIPKISIYDYLMRIKNYSSVESSTMITAMIYIDRLAKNANIILSKYNIHRILFTAIVMAIKNNEDDIYTNAHYARVGGISLKEMNRLEIKFLEFIDFNLYVSKEIYNEYSTNLKK